MVIPAGQLSIAVCGALGGAGVFVLARALRATRPRLGAHLSALYEAPRPARDSTASAFSDESGAWLADLARRHGLGGLLLEDDLALAERSVDAHTTSRLLHALLGLALALPAWAGLSLITALPAVFLILLPIFAVAAGVMLADRQVKALAARRRTEAQLAVSAYVDLVAILLIGGLPLSAALRTGADQGTGWAFTQLQSALSWASDRGLGPDAGLDHLAARLPVPEFADLALSIASARRGASPVTALESKAAFMRGASSAQARSEAAVADAQIELPSAFVALAFMAFLAYPLISLLTTTTTGVLP